MWLYRQAETQWRAGMHGRTGLDYTPFIAIIQDMRWPVIGTLAFLSVIERTALECWDEQRESS